MQLCGSNRYLVDVNLYMSLYCGCVCLPHFCLPLCLATDGIWSQNPEATKGQLRRLLAGSGAKWKLVVGHHPIASFGSHCKFGMQGDCEQMAWLEPELQVRGMCAWGEGVYSK